MSECEDKHKLQQTFFKKTIYLDVRKHIPGMRRRQTVVSPAGPEDMLRLVFKCSCRKVAFLRRSICRVTRDLPLPAPRGWHADLSAEARTSDTWERRSCKVPTVSRWTQFLPLWATCVDSPSLSCSTWFQHRALPAFVPALLSRFLHALLSPCTLLPCEWL